MDQILAELPIMRSMLDWVIVFYPPAHLALETNHCLDLARTFSRDLGLEQYLKMAELQDPVHESALPSDALLYVWAEQHMPLSLWSWRKIDENLGPSLTHEELCWDAVA